MPSAPDAPSGRDAAAANGPEPAREQDPAEEPPQQDDQQDDQQDAEQDAAEQPADEAAPASEPVPSPEKTKKPAKPRKEQASEQADKPAVTPGGRDRKKVEHYKPPEAPMAKTATTVQEGEGTKLREIPNVHFKLSKIPGREELMELLHDVLYRRKGQASTRKRGILDFSGFTFPAASQEAELQKVAAKLGRMTATALNQLLDIFELPRGAGEEGHKDAKVKRISDWLVKPEATSTKDLAAQAAKQREAAKRKREREEKAKEKKAAKKAKAGGGKAAKATPAKAAKTATKKRKQREEDDEDEQAAEEEDSDGDDLALGALAKMPTDAALVKQVQSVLASVDVQEFNLKALMKQLAEHYGTDMAAKKPLIKTTAIQYCLDNPGGADDDEADAAADADEEAPVADAAEAVAEAAE